MLMKERPGQVERGKNLETIFSIKTMYQCAVPGSCERDLTIPGIRARTGEWHLRRDSIDL